MLHSWYHLHSDNWLTMKFHPCFDIIGSFPRVVWKSKLLIEITEFCVISTLVGSMKTFEKKKAVASHISPESTTPLREM